MNKDKLFSAIGQIDDELVARADKPAAKKKTGRVIWIRWCAAAACLVIAVTAAVIFADPNENVIQGRDSIAPMAPFAAPEPAPAVAAAPASAPDPAPAEPEGEADAEAARGDAGGEAIPETSMYTVKSGAAEPEELNEPVLSDNELSVSAEPDNSLGIFSDEKPQGTDSVEASDSPSAVAEAEPEPAPEPEPMPQPAAIEEPAETEGGEMGVMGIAGEPDEPVEAVDNEMGFMSVPTDALTGEQPASGLTAPEPGITYNLSAAVNMDGARLYLGMSQRELVELLGTPDADDVTGELDGDGELRVNNAYYPDGENGFTVGLVGNSDGLAVDNIYVFGDDALRLDNGISVGSTKAEIESAFGVPPDLRETAVNSIGDGQFAVEICRYTISQPDWLLQIFTENGVAVSMELFSAD